MVTADFAVPENSDDGPASLRAIRPSLDLCEALGADLIRICMKTDADIDAARRAADEASERGIRLAHQSHFGSLFETVEGSRDVLRRVDRENFGLIYEPANWMVCREDYRGAIRELAPWIFNVYLQNHRVRPGGPDVVETWKCGRVELDSMGIWEKDGADIDGVLDDLQSVGYDGYVTVHQAFGGWMTPEEAARRSYEYLRKVTE